MARQKSEIILKVFTTTFSLFIFHLYVKTSKGWRPYSYILSSLFSLVSFNTGAKENTVWSADTAIQWPLGSCARIQELRQILSTCGL